MTKIITIFFLLTGFAVFSIAQPTIIADNPRLLPIEALEEIQYNFGNAIGLDIGNRDKHQTYYLYVERASSINHKMIDNMPYIQFLVINELDSLPDCIQRWKDLQILYIHNYRMNLSKSTQKQDAYIPEGFGNFFSYLKVFEVNIESMQEDILHDKILNGAYPRLEKLRVSYFTEHEYWDEEAGEYKRSERGLDRWVMPKIAEGWSNLQEIELTAAKNISEVAKGWKQLETVTLHNYEGSLEGLQYCSKLTSLSIYDANEQIDDICQILSLESLGLNRVRGLEELPASLGQLTNLKTLTLYQTSIKHLPVDMSGMQSLKELRVTGTPLQELPNSICTIKGLKTIYIGGGQLRALPEDIGNIDSLSSISVEDNRIFELPESILKLKNLISLDVSYNRISTLPNGAYQWAKTPRFIDLSGNQLEELPSSFVQYLRRLEIGKDDYFRVCLGENWFSKKTQKKITKQVAVDIEWERRYMW